MLYVNTFPVAVIRVEGGAVRPVSLLGQAEEGVSIHTCHVQE